jgi:transposase
MQNVASTSPPSAAEIARMSAGQVAALMQSKDASIQLLKQQVDALKHRLEWFERQVFGSKSERFAPQPDPAQLHLGEAFPVPEQITEQRKAVPAHTRGVPRSDMAGDTDESKFFDESRVPVQTITVPNPETAGLAADQFEVIAEKITYRLAQRPGSYVVLKYVRQVIKRKDTQTLHCPPAPTGVIEGSRADVSFAAGLLVEKFAYHLPLYRQHQRLADAGITVSRPWLTQLTQRTIGLLEPIYEAQLESIRASRVKAMDESVPRTQGREALRCCGEDEGRPLGAAFQREAPNHPLLLCSKGVVVSEWENAAARPRQVGIGEMSESEPLSDVSKRIDVVETGGVLFPRDKACGESDYCAGGNRH